jgi:hypothetical protein
MVCFGGRNPRVFISSITKPVNKIVQLVTADARIQNFFDFIFFIVVDDIGRRLKMFLFLRWEGRGNVRSEEDFVKDREYFPCFWEFESVRRSSMLFFYFEWSISLVIEFLGRSFRCEVFDIELNLLSSFVFYGFSVFVVLFLHDSLCYKRGFVDRLVDVG